MIKSYTEKFLTSIILIMLSGLLILSYGKKIPVLDAETDTYFSEAITQAGLSYATCRVINASVSIIKDSTLSLEPMGLGVSLAVGQVVDPIDDMTERLSDVLVTAIVSLGVQKLMYEISLLVAAPIMAIFLLFLSLLIWFNNERIVRLRNITIKILIVVAIGRLCFPVSAMANTLIQEHYFTKQISEAKNALSINSTELHQLRQMKLPKIDGVTGTIVNSAVFIKKKTRK